MASEDIQRPVVVNVDPVAGLHVHAAIAQRHAGRHPWSRDVLHVYPVVRPTTEHVFVPIVVKVCNTHAPLRSTADLAQIVVHKATLCGLVERVQDVALVQNNQVVVAIAVQIGKAHTTSTVEGGWQGVVGVGERLAQGHRRPPSEEHAQSGNVEGKRIHGWWFQF